MWVYVIVGLAVLLLLLGCYGILSIAAEKEDHRQALDANDTLIRKNRKLEAENRRLHSQLNAKEYQVNSRWELRYEELEAKNRDLQRELKIKETMIKGLAANAADGVVNNPIVTQRQRLRLEEETRRRSTAAFEEANAALIAADGDEVAV